MTSYEDRGTSTSTQSSQRQFAAVPATADGAYGPGCTPSAALKPQPEVAQSSAIRRLFCWHQGSWRQQQQQQMQQQPQLNNIISYPAYFAEARFRVDAISFCLTSTLLTLLSNTRALHNLCTSTSTTSTTTATCLTSMQASCPHRSSMLPFLSLPCTLTSAASSQHTMSVPSAQAGAASQLQFPCAQSFVVQSAWVARRLPAVALLLHSQNKSYEHPIRWLVCIISLASLFLLPRWYLQHGRMLLVPASLVLPRALSTLALLQAALAGGHVSPVLRAYLDTMWSGSVKASAVMVYQTLILPMGRRVQKVGLLLLSACAHLGRSKSVVQLPGMAQPLASATWLLLNITNEALLLGPMASLPRILSYALSNLLLGVAIPCGLQLLYERSLRTQYLAAWHRRQQLPAVLDAAVASCAGANTAPPAPPAAALPPPAPGAVPPAIPAAIRPMTPAPTAAAVATGLVATPAGSVAPSSTAACTAAVVANSPAGQVPEPLAATSALSQPPRRSGRLYRGVTRACHVAVKVHHHDAFEKREAIQATLEATLRHKFNSFPAASGASHKVQQPQSPLPLPPQQQHLLLQQGAAATPTASAAPSAAPPTPQRRLYSPLALSTVAIQGCLQLLATAHSLLAVGGDVGGPPPAATVAASAAGDSQSSDDAVQPAWAPQVHDGLAELELVMREQVEELYGTEDCRVTISAVAGSTCSTRVGGQVTQSAAAVVQLLPMLVEAGATGQQEVVVEVTGLPGWWEGVAGAEAEVVASCWKGGERVVVKGPVDFGTVCQDGSDNAMGQCSLQLPPHLDAAPLEVHVVATCPGHEGVLLGYAHSMALPAPAARELLANANHPHLPSDPETHASWLRVLGDVAAVWNLLQPLPDTCAAAATAAVEQNAAVARFAVANLTAYCAAAELPAVVGFLEQLAAGQAAGDPAAPAHAVAPTPHAPGQPLFPPAAPNTPTTAPHAAVPSLPEGSLSCSPAGPEAAASASPPTHQPASGSTAAAPARQERYQDRYKEQYTAWKLQQGRKADLLAALFMIVLWVVFLSKEAWHAGGAPHALRDQAAFAAVDIASMSLPWLALALGSERLRARRALVMVLQSALYGAKCLLVAYCWVPQPQQFRDGDSTMFILATLALLFPTLQRVGWRQQLVCNFVLQEIPRYVMHANATRCMEGVQVVVPPSMLHAALVPLVAAAVAWVVQHRSKAQYRRLEAATKHKGD